MLGDQGLDHRIQPFAGQNLIERIKRQADPVIGDAALRKL
jgi:hypothetical protein